ncbi:MAG: PilX N-terminal domain-containing pilus assembly protein [candidate division NC10 bacterium]|nr:PilX N-terminal domain-containing pilus assembly protein [candidate division NC10 bacterium]
MKFDLGRAPHRASRGVLVQEGGATLVVALLALVVLSILGLAFLTISKTESDISSNDRDAGRALYVAEAGLERFKRDLRYDIRYPGTSNTSGTDRYLASPAPSADGTSEDNTGTYVNILAPVKRYYDLGAALPAVSSDPPTLSFWGTVSPLSAYHQTSLNGGSYSLKLAKGTMDDLFVLSTGSIGSRIARMLEAKFEPKIFSVWDNAIFGGQGATGMVVNGNVTVAGSVHVLGTGLTSTDTAIDLSGGAKILNQYSGISLTLDQKLVQGSAYIAARPGKLRTEYRVKRGLTNIGSGASGVGESGGNVKAVYTNDGFVGSFPSNVYSDNGRNMKYDLPADVSIPFPTIDAGNPPLSTALDITASLPASGSKRKLDSDTPSFSLGPDAHGNSIQWNQGTGTLTLSGVVKVNSSLDLAKKNNAVNYSGVGTLYVTGSVYVHDHVLPATNNSYPIANCLGLVAGTDIEIATGGGEANILTAGAFYAANKVKIGKQTQHAGSIVCNYFDLGSQVPSIYQVPLLARNLPPGMPAGDPYIFIKTVYWREVTG